MPTSVTGNRRAPSRRAGFTLVELLVALVVIGLATTVAVIAWPRADAAPRQTAERLAARLTVAAHQSVLTGRPHGLTVDARGATFLRREAAGWRPVPADAQPRALAWPAGLTVVLDRPAAPKVDKVGEREAPPAPMVAFDPLGGADEFVVSVTGGRVDYLVKADATGRIVVERRGTGSPSWERRDDIR